jgi:CubicO group peptidase (beta-lactamase class C family)
MAADRPAALDRFVSDWVASGEVTAAFGLVAARGRTRWSGGVAAGDAPAPTASSLFDAASLTKPWIATLALALDEGGTLPLATAVGEVWPGCDPRLARRTLGDLLRHRAGLGAWTPLYRRCRSRDEVERLLLSGALLEGASERYSDLDYLLWGFAAERRLGVDLATLLRRAVLEPLGIDGVAVRPGARAGVVPCRCDNAREVELAARQGIRVARRAGPPLGEPQDGNARFVAGLAGHAGLFVSAEASLGLAREWLDALAGRGALLGRSQARAALDGGGEYALGWARRRVAGSAGRALSSAAFGHIGFTGTSLWIDPPARMIAVLLAHRREPSSRLNLARRRFHALAARSVQGRSSR